MDHIEMQPEHRTSWRSFVAMFGLPCIIGVAAIDPGNLEVDLQAGAALGYTLIWSLLLASVLGWILQTLAAHVTIYTNLHLAELCHRVYKPHPLLSRLVFAINLLSVIAFDVAEVVGTAVATRLLLGIPLWVGMVLSVCDTMLVLHLQKKGMTRIEIVIEGLLFILAACLIYEFILAGPSWPSILRGSLVPSFGSEQRSGGVLLAISIMGSVIMSHNLFLHSWLQKERSDRKIQSQTQAYPAQIEAGPELEQYTSGISVVTDTADEQERQRSFSLSEDAFQSNHQHLEQGLFTSSPVQASLPRPASELFRDCRYATIESAAIFFSTFMINTCVLVVAATLPQALLASLDGEIGLKNAGALLHRVFGQQLASTAWGLALLASGHAATVTGVLASQAVCEGFLQVRIKRTGDSQEVPNSLTPNGNGNSNISSSRIILISRLIAILPALVVALIAGESGSDSLAVGSQAMLSFSLPFAAIPLFKVLEAVASVRPLYSRALLISGYVVFSVVMIANVLAIREFAILVSRFGTIPLALFWILTVALSAFFIALIVTPVRMSDITADGDDRSVPNERSHLLAAK